MKYVILNDGETYTNLKSCAIYDSKTGKLYRVKKDREINLNTCQEGFHWEKGIDEIIESEKDGHIR